MDFDHKKRQQFLTEEYYIETKVELKDVIVDYLSEPNNDDNSTIEEGWEDSYFLASQSMFNLFVLEYTAGCPLEVLRNNLDDLVTIFEIYSEKLRLFKKDKNEPAFDIHTFDGYYPYLSLISLCYLLHRKDLLSRVALLVDGANKKNAGEDWLIEEFLAFNEKKRYKCEDVLLPIPYFELSNAFVTDDNSISLSHLTNFLKNWYKDLASAPWHDTHIEQAGYYGYWSFEAATTVILLGIDDDSSLYQYLYYPKDLVQFAKEFVPSADDISLSKKEHLRCEAGQICPKKGEWYSPANDMEKQHFNQGEVMPEIANNPWGLTIWYMTE